MMRFIFYPKHDGCIGVSFSHMQAFLDWAKTKGRIVIETDGDVPVIRQL